MSSFIKEEELHYNQQAVKNTISDFVIHHSKFEFDLRQGIFRLPYSKWKDEVLVNSHANLSILDYGCGDGLHTCSIQKMIPSADIIGIDIAENALNIASKCAAAIFEAKTPRFYRMDAHQLEFPDQSFDLVVDFGTLSSLDLNIALKEIYRVLRPGGSFVAIETFGHHPLANLKRRLNLWRRKRTKHATDNILDTKKLKVLNSIFSQVSLSYFGITTLFQRVLPSIMLPLLEKIDSWLLKFFYRYAFKIVIVGKK